ncbi:MAG: hypothetical protein JW951_03335 [Lentisphaerae bacterium]|nr:hypothetical protein [Lentisphaerota bacterium]
MATLQYRITFPRAAAVLLAVPLLAASCRAPHARPPESEAGAARGLEDIRQRKYVFAHYMPGYSHPAHPHMRFSNPYVARTRSRESGAQYREAPLFASDWFKEGHAVFTNRRDFIRWEIRTARDAGIDGFMFDYGAGYSGAQNRSNRPDRVHCFIEMGIFDDFFSVAEAEFPDFKLLLCVDQATIRKPSRRTDTINQFLDRYGKSPNGLQYDGKLLLTSYRASALPPYDFQGCQGAPAGYIFENTRQVIASWGDVFAGLHQPVALIADLPPAWLYAKLWNFTDADCRRFFDLWARPFAGLSVFGPLDTPEEQRRIYTMMNDACRKHGKLFGPCVAQGWRRNNLDQRVFMHDAELMLESWKLALELDPGMVQIVTWNDYGEQTDIAPSINHGYALLELNAYFIERFKTGRPPELEKDSIILAYKRYPGRPEPTDFPDTAEPWYPLSENLHVITLARAPAQLVVEGYGTRPVEPGLQNHRFPLQTGPVSAVLVRDGRTAASVNGLSPVVEQPYREMLGTCWISSSFRERFRRDAGFEFDPGHPAFTDLNTNGVADWVELIRPDRKVIPADGAGT